MYSQGHDMDYLRRKIDKFLDEWFISENKKPLIIKGARQIGKTKTVEEFAKRNNLSLVEINFVLMAGQPVMAIKWIKFLKTFL